MPEPGIHKNVIAFSISREMAIDYGLVEATPEEVAERNASGERLHAEQRALREAFKAWIATPVRGLTKEVLDLHAPDDSDYGVTCKGCTPDGEYGPQDWPCETVAVVAAWGRYPLPGSTMPGRRYEDEWKPWDGKPFAPLPYPEAFVTLDPNDIG